MLLIVKLPTGPNSLERIEVVTVMTTTYMSSDSIVGDRFTNSVFLCKSHCNFPILCHFGMIF